MRRREFIAGLGGAAAVWPLVVRAQQGKLPKVGFLSSASAKEWTPFLSAFLGGLRETEHVEGRHFTIEYRWAEGQYDRLPALAADLVRNRSDLVVAVTPPAALAAKAATATIPVVFLTGADPVALGLVASINRPGGNLTGITFATAELASKLLQTIQQLVPNLTSIAMLVNPGNQSSVAQSRDLQIAVQSLGAKCQVLSATNEADLDKAFEQIKGHDVDALVVATDSFFLVRKNQLVSLSERFAVPTVYNLREYVIAGGLLSYGTSVADAYRQVGIYVGRILKGARPADLPVLQPTKFELVINPKTAKALGLTVPDKLLALADEVIE
jgi:putative ABC transport system substrate-binding protein